MSTGWTRKASFVLIALAAMLAWPALAEEMVLSWNGAEKDPHPCLYVTAKDVAAAKATSKDLVRADRQDDVQYCRR